MFCDLWSVKQMRPLYIKLDGEFTLSSKRAKERREQAKFLLICRKLVVFLLQVSSVLLR